MAVERYDVFFSGKIMTGQDPDAVRRRVGRLFKLDGERLERLFSGDPVAVKRGVDMDAAIKYRVAFRDAGALVDIRPQAAPTSAAPPSAGPGGLSLAPANSGTLLDCAPPPPRFTPPDLSGWSLGAVGATIDTTPEPPPAAIDSTRLTLAPQGSLEAYAEEVTPLPLPDIGRLRLIEPEEPD